MLFLSLSFSILMFFGAILAFKLFDPYKQETVSLTVHHAKIVPLFISFLFGVLFSMSLLLSFLCQFFFLFFIVIYSFVVWFNRMILMTHAAYRQKNTLTMWIKIICYANFFYSRWISSEYHIMPYSLLLSMGYMWIDHIPIWRITFSWKQNQWTIYYIRELNETCLFFAFFVLIKCFYCSKWLSQR